MDIILIILLSLTQIIPVVVILLHTFGDYVRQDALARSLMITIYFSIICISTAVLASPEGMNTTRIFIVTVIFSICTSFLASLYFRLPVSINFFTILVLKSYIDTTTLFAKLFFVHAEAALDFTLFLKQDVLGHLAISIVTAPLLYLFMTLLLKPVVKETGHMGFWKWLWIIPLLFYFIYNFSAQPGYLEIFRPKDGTLFLFPYFWKLTTFFSYCLILKILSNTAATARLEDSLRHMDLQNALQKEQYELLRENIEETRKAKHDLRHHLLAMQGYIKEKDLDGLERYIMEYSDSLAAPDGIPVCDNYAINILVLHFKGIAQKHQIPIEISIGLPEQLPIQESDFCIILGNLLENAIEACIRIKSGISPFIHLSVGTAGNHMLILTIKNSYDNPIRIQDHTFLSSKREGEGIGLSSIQHMVSRYDGVFKYEYKDNVFSVYVWLNS